MALRRPCRTAVAGSPPSPTRRDERWRLSTTLAVGSLDHRLGEPKRVIHLRHGWQPADSGEHWRGHLVVYLRFQSPAADHDGPPGRVIQNTYDAQHRVAEQTLDPTGLDRTTTFAYSLLSDGTDLTAITDPKGNVTDEDYRNNELLSMTRGAGTSSASTTAFTYDRATLGVTSVTDDNGHEWAATSETVAAIFSRLPTRTVTPARTRTTPRTTY